MRMLEALQDRTIRPRVPYLLRSETPLFHEIPQRQDVRHRSRHTYLPRTQLRKKLESKSPVPDKDPRRPAPLRHGAVHPQGQRVPLPSRQLRQGVHQAGKHEQAALGMRGSDRPVRTTLRPFTACNSTDRNPPAAPQSQPSKTYARESSSAGSKTSPNPKPNPKGVDTTVRLPSPHTACTHHH